MFTFTTKNESTMNIVRYNETEPIRVSDTVTRRFLYTPNLMTVIVEFTGGPAAEPDPFHTHPHEQTSYVAEGEVLFLMEGETPAHLVPGDMVAIPAGRPHAIRLLTPTARLIDSFTPIREDFL